MTAIINKTKTEKALQAAYDLFENNNQPPTHEVFQEEIWLKYNKVFTHNEDARTILFSMMDYACVFHALEDNDINSSVAKHHYSKLFLDNGVINPNLPDMLIEKAKLLKARFDEARHQDRLTIETNFIRAQVEVGDDIEALKKQLATVNEKLSKYGLVYLEQDPKAPSCDYVLQDLKTNEKRALAFNCKTEKEYI